MNLNWYFGITLIIIYYYIIIIINITQVISTVLKNYSESAFSFQKVTHVNVTSYYPPLSTS